MTSWLHEQRLEAAREVVLRRRVGTVLDLGCGDGDLLVRLARKPQIERIVGVDLCPASLGRLRSRISAMVGVETEIDLVDSCLTDTGQMFASFDCAMMIETIEHFEPHRLSAVERAVFAEMRPATIVITTPNAEFNALLGVPSRCFRHRDHRFEWDRARFQRWANGVADRNGYTVSCRSIAGNHPVLGGASQIAVFDVCAESVVLPNA